MARVLVIDDHDTMREGMAVTLQKQGHAVTAVQRGTEGVAAFGKQPFDLVITDLKMDGVDGLEVVRQVRKASPNAVVMVVTAFGTVETAVSAMQLGAYDFITKPFSPEVLRAKVEKGLELFAARAQVEKLTARTQALEADVALSKGTLVGTSEPMQKLLSLVKKAAATDATVLIRGESGTGKELVARLIHEQSPRAKAPFVVVHCAALAETLLESELFGHERGAFTGAVKRKLGRFELADGGTLFLDEIGEISPSIQTKLLRVLQERAFERVGGEETLRVDVRVVSATHRDLTKEVGSGRFREDLYYRLHVVPLTLPALRERPEDIPGLAEHFIVKSGPRLNRAVRGLTDQAKRALSHYPWPGNVRELENVIEQALVFAEGAALDLGDLPPALQPQAQRPLPGELPPMHGDRPLPDVLEDLERALILKAFEKANRVKTETARLLGIKTSALYYKLEKYGFIQKGEDETDEGPSKI
jgi:two-component system response regulator HydG